MGWDAIALRNLGLGMSRPVTANTALLAQANDEFVDIDYRTNGTVGIITDANGDRILRFNNFVKCPTHKLADLLHRHCSSSI